MTQQSTLVPKIAQLASQNAFLTARMGTPILVRLMDGEVITGELVTFNTYAIVVKVKGGKDTLIFKHAIAYLTTPSAEEKAQ